MKKIPLSPFSVIIPMVVLVPFTNLYAETVQEAVEKVISGHDRILAVKADLSASESRVKQTIATSWTPEFNVSTHFGAEAQSNQASGANTDLYSRELDFKLTQRVWDWGKADADISVSQSTRSQMQASLDAASQLLMLDAVTAYIGLKRSQKLVEYARQSIENIQRQSEVEDARVSLGSGYSTDVLQVKTQLAGAEARLIQSKGALQLAKNRVRTIFQRDPEEVALLEMGPPDFNILPATITQAVDYSLAANPMGRQLDAARKMLDSQAESVMKSTFYPAVNAIIEHKAKEDVSGVAEFERETFARLEVSFPFNTGLAGLDSINASRQDAEAARRRHRDLLLQISEQTRSAWNNLETAKNKASMLRNQARLAEKFLELAREERKLNKRTLLDILNGETALINAQSDALSAEADVKIAFYTLIQSMGALSADLLGQDHAAGIKPLEVVPVSEDVELKLPFTKEDVSYHLSHQW
ncbi:MAG: TolC family protein [Magnetococcales bacterium]|nr:TolC family protein [Magnetococcales bacterium]